MAHSNFLNSPAQAPEVFAPKEAEAIREVRHEYTKAFPSILEGLGAAILFSTYQAGKVVTVAASGGELALSYHNFERAMGIAARPDVLAVGARSQVWFLRGAPTVAAQVEPIGRHDACYVTRSSQFTGEIQGHEMAWSGEDLWVVNTAFSCLCTLHPEHSFEPRWRPSSITALAPEDRCHLNGMAMLDGRPKYASVLGETDSPQGWRGGKAAGSALIAVAGGEVVARGFAMRHSPRIHGGRVFLLHSGVGRLIVIELFRENAIERRFSVAMRHACCHTRASSAEERSWTTPESSGAGHARDRPWARGRSADCVLPSRSTSITICSPKSSARAELPGQVRSRRSTPGHFGAIRRSAR